MKNKILIIVLLLVIGFASVSTTLVINGNIGIKLKSEDFNVIFVSAEINGNNEAKAIISEDKKSITFETDKLSIVGDKAKLIYKVKNNSTQYDANVKVSCTGGNEEYLSIQGEFAGKTLPLTSPELMGAQEVRMGTLSAELIKAYVGEDTKVPITCKLEVEGEGRETIEEYKEEYKEVLLNGTDPVIKEGLIPVIIEDDGTVKKADTTSEWYKYEDKRWANAVILSDTYDLLNRESKIHGATKNEGYVSFDGVNDYIDLGFTNYDFGNSVSRIIQIKFNDLTKYQEFYGNWEGAGFGCSINLKPGKINCGLFVKEEGKYFETFSKNNIEVDKLYTIVSTYDGENMKLYINGELEDTIVVSGTIKPSNVSLSIGGNINGNNSTVNNSNINVYKTALFDRALSEFEIKQNFSNDIKIVNTEGLLDYQNFTNDRNVGETILENNIESYFVWIPRYKYQIFDEGNYTTAINSTPTESIAKEIQVEFENKDTTVSNGSTKDAWLTHSAFTNFDVNGLWVGKFETTGSTSNITVKPGASSLKNLTVGNMFKTAYNYKRELDSHMMKNTEWGAVAYLSHSKYGINKEININNNSNYLTGYSAVVGTDQSSNPGTSGTDATKTLPYNTSTGYMSSTTGNITGIYDMSGGAHEYMASYMSGKIGASGLSAEELTTYAKYLDKYSSASTITSYNKRILGDATGEMGPFYYYKDGYHNNWYADASDFVDSSLPWVVRGGRYSDGVFAGQFNFRRYTGGSGWDIGFRLVLAL